MEIARVDTTRLVWKPQPQLLVGWGSWSQRTARVAPRDNVKVAPLTGRIRSHPRIKIISVSLQLRPPGVENEHLSGRYCPVRCGNPNPTG